MQQRSTTAPCPRATCWSGSAADARLSRVLSPTAATVRLTLHVLAATIWVGGQFTLAGLLPVLRTASTASANDLPRRAARAYNRIAWPAFGVLVLTGMWNLIDV